MQIILLPILVLALALTMDLRRGGVSCRWMIFAFGSMLFTGLIGVMQTGHSGIGARRGNEPVPADFVHPYGADLGHDPAAREKAARRPGGRETIVFPRPAARDILRRGTRNDSQPQPLSLGSASEHGLHSPVVNGGLILMTAMVSVVVFHERLKVKQIAGLILGVIIICVM